MTLIDQGALLALSISVIWALTGIISVGTARALGGMRFNRLRISMVAVVMVMVAAVLVIQQGTMPTWTQFGVLSLSGFAGIFIGDTLLYSTVARLGPRRTTMLFATHAPMTALLGLALGETLSGRDWLGVALVFAGVTVAIVYGKRRDQLHVWESVRGLLVVGVLLGLGSALAQAVGTIIANPVMDNPDLSARPDPIVASTIRVSVSAVALWLVMLVPGPWTPTPVEASARLTPRFLIVIGLSGFLGLGLGMTLFLLALGMTDAALVATLSSMTPVAQLPLIWLITGQRPALLAWVGAVLAGLGTVLLLYQFS
uniref:7 permeases of the drug/metabolite transporter (Dmt) superfamily n=1 Tax=uncultured alpha proteobacterium HF0010_30A23 TaxID=710802 RepID=E0XRN5_9PROT|nr:7 permeases of the drug/metabolite transporter (dmt) superfamily [uncultured alpha proteobacterium HF0010_30A23]